MTLNYFKNAKRGATVSLNTFITEYASPYAYKLVAGNMGVSDTKITMPLYMTIFIFCRQHRQTP